MEKVVYIYFVDHEKTEYRLPLRVHVWEMMKKGIPEIFG